MKEKIESKSEVRRNICGGKLREPIDVNDDLRMVEEGLRLPLVRINRDVFKKDSWEKKEVKKWKHLKVSEGVGHIIEPYETIKGRLTLYYENINRLPNFRTTETVKCFRSEIDEILRIKKEKDKLKVSKYYFKY